jgi:hypothetical protein
MVHVVATNQGHTIPISEDFSLTGETVLLKEQGFLPIHAIWDQTKRIALISEFLFILQPR